MTLPDHCAESVHADQIRRADLVAARALRLLEHEQDIEVIARVSLKAALANAQGVAKICRDCCALRQATENVEQICNDIERA